MKKKHSIKTIDDIKYCEEHGLNIYSEVESFYYEFNDGQWNRYNDENGDLRAYNSCLPLSFDLYYYEEEQEATKKDIGKLCWFWDTDEDKNDDDIGILQLVEDGKIPYYRKGDGIFCHCRPLTKEEIKEFMEEEE